MQEDGKKPLKSIEQISERIKILRFAEDLLSKFDKLLLSKGASLMLVLPPLIALVVGIGVWKEHRSPNWWSSFSPVVFDLELTPFMDWLSVMFLIAMLLMLSVTTAQAMISRMIVTYDSLIHSHLGNNIEKSHGFEQITQMTNDAINKRLLSTMITLLALLLQLIILVKGSFDDESEILRVFSLSCVLINFSLLIKRNDVEFNTSDEWGLVGAYKPAFHPSILNYPLAEILLTICDPLLRDKIEKVIEEINTKRRVKLDNHSFFEKIVLLHYLHDEGRMTTTDLISKIKKEYKIKEPSILFDLRLWSELISQIRKTCDPFNRLMTRTLQKNIDDLKQIRKSGYYFDVDIDDIFDDTGSMFVQLINASDKKRSVLLKTQSAHTEPETTTHSIELNPQGKAMMELGNRPWNSDLERREVIMSAADESSAWIWMNLKSKSPGELVINVRLEDSDGHLIDGRTLISLSRTPMLKRFSVMTSRIAFSIAFIIPLIRLGWWGLNIFT
ncbi:MAG: hypothetical protein CMA27_01630 [Euryarchaeota archaeon]|nr:hypothetical protein [Euryarchaeota archaeon]|tara:strand:- start:112 stop:1614 length:1503 start_codon:yes stop_codon:yes gene_type:complete